MSDPVASQGKIEIFDDVIRAIAGVAMSGVKGIVGPRGTFIDGIKAATTGKRDFHSGVDVKKTADDKFEIDLYIIIEYDVRVMEVAQEAQRVVKERVEAITGRSVGAVNVHIADIKLPDSILSREQD
ncbi:MAG: Alkaline shock protein 23 [bacterium ADurb.Bin236]|nr:MAG: Alkaline shock protein 23 [bacterium ADurb.Bin236]HPN95131.1 Asp23/Gls24 family envelope stress response protein [bacterium]